MEDNVIAHPFRGSPLALKELAINDDIQVEAALQLMLDADHALRMLKSVPAETLAKVRIPYVDDQGCDGIMGAVPFYDHLRASVEFTLSRIRFTTDGGRKPLARS